MQLQRNPFSIRACASRILDNWSRAAWNLEMGDILGGFKCSPCHASFDLFLFWQILTPKGGKASVLQFQSTKSISPAKAATSSGSVQMIEFFSPLFQSCSCGIIRARVANWDYSLRLCAFWNTLETKQQLHMCELDLATWKSYDTTNMTRYEFTMEQHWATEHSRKGSWWDIPCSSTAPPPLMAWTGRLPLRTSAFHLGFRFYPQWNSWKRCFFIWKRFSYDFLEATNMQASDGCIQIWCGATSKWKSWTLSSTVVTISLTMSKVMNLTLPRHTESEKFWQISMVSFDFVWFLTLSWDSHRCGFVFHWFGGIWNGVCLPHACLFGHLWARCQWFGQSLLWS